MRDFKLTLMLCVSLVAAACAGPGVRVTADTLRRGSFVVLEASSPECVAILRAIPPPPDRRAADNWVIFGKIVGWRADEKIQITSVGATMDRDWANYVPSDVGTDVTADLRPDGSFAFYSPDDRDVFIILVMPSKHPGYEILSTAKQLCVGISLLPRLSPS